MKFKDSILRDILAYVFGTIMLCVVVPAIIIVIGIYYPLARFAQAVAYSL